MVGYAIFTSHAPGNPAQDATAPAGSASGRILVPYLAKPFYWAARTHLRTWDPVYFGLLIANSIFCATTSLVMVHAGLRLTENAGTALLGAALYLLNFAVPNLQLAGLVDCGEACLMMILAWVLLMDKWWLLPLLGIVGALAKETFVPFSAIFSITWYLTSEHPDGAGPGRVGYIFAMIILGSLTTSMVQFGLTGHFLTAWNIAVAMDSKTNYLRSFFACITDTGFWGVFVWLLPLGLWSWRKMRRPWLMATLTTAGTALLLGTYNAMGGTVARPIFNVAGPLLALSTSVLLTKADVGSGKPSVN